ncbi:ATPase with role in protein import into the ER, partial [Gonapodya sp. JEL0774]
MDIGNTFTRVAVQYNKSLMVIRTEQGDRTIPSLVTFTEDGIVCGPAARNLFHHDSDNMLSGVISLIGLTYTNESHSQAIALPQTIQLVNVSGRVGVQVRLTNETKTYAMEEVLAATIKRGKRVAELELGVNVTHAIATVPVHFNDAQRQALREAGTIAGLT